MKKNNKEKTKKIAIVTGLMVAGALAIAGISFTLWSEEPDILIADEPNLTTAVNIDTEVVVPEITPSALPSSETASEPEVVISLDVNHDAREDGAVQSIQPDPVKTDEEKPSEPPAEVQDVNTADKENPPASTQIPAESTPKPDTTNDHPQSGTVKDGKIYIEGFGWVDYEGGGTSVIQGNDIYENGNTIGIMD